MLKKCCGLSLLIVVLAAVSGCRRSDSEPLSQKSLASSASGKVIARVHWLGKSQMARESNAATFMEIWNRPVTARLERQTLDKLSSAPRRLLLHEPGINPTNAADVLFRPLLDDLVQEESYIEVRQQANAPGELVLAIKLAEPRALLWKTNLAAALQALTGIRAASSADGKGWSFKKHHPPNLCELSRAGNWTVVGLATDSNSTMNDLIALIQKSGTPFQRGPTNFWLEGEADLPALGAAFPRALSISTDSPSLLLTVTGDGQNVRTYGNLHLAKPLNLQIEPWKIPTNTIREPLISFTAARGVAAIGEGLPILSFLRGETLPNQVFVWALGRIPFQSFAAAPVADATNYMIRIGPKIASEVNKKLPQTAGAVVVGSNQFSLVWTGMPFATPYLLPVLDGGRPFLLGGLFPNTIMTNLIPEQLIAQFSANTNLIYYDWEITQERLMQWRYMNDLFHIAATPVHRPAIGAESASVLWVGNVSSNLGNTATEIQALNETNLAFRRKSSIGLTGCEIEFLAGWLESPDFPGLGKRPGKDSGTGLGARQ